MIIVKRVVSTAILAGILMALIGQDRLANGAVATQILIQEKGNKTPARVHLRAGGKPIIPPGYPAWRDHFVCDGTALVELEAVEHEYEIERGPEYFTVKGRFDPAGLGGRPLVIELSRMVNWPERGWWPGDLHVHRRLDEIELLMKAEELHVAPVITWWNNRNLWASQAIPEERDRKFDGQRFYNVMAGEDEREGGALLYFRLPAPLSISGASREFPSPMKFVEQARANREAWIDIEKPFWWDVPIWLACMKADSIGIANNHQWRSGMLDNEAWGRPRDRERFPSPQGNGFWTQTIYYHILNSGFRIPPSAGSASGVLPNPVGYNRVYVHTGSRLDVMEWWEQLARGRCFVSNGPLLDVRAQGALPGEVFQLPDENAMALPLQIKVVSRGRLDRIEIIRNGEIDSTIPLNETGFEGHATVRLERDGWFLVRVIGKEKETFRFASTGPFYVESKVPRPSVSKKSAQFFLDWVRERKVRVRLDNAAQREEVLRYHNLAEAFWEEKVRRANRE